MNSFGNKFRVSIFGESHGEAIGAVIDGVPAGLPLAVEDFMADIDRRRSGARGTTPRRESDNPALLSGVYNGHTTGAPLAVIFRNENTRSSDYSLFERLPRPGHADRVAAVKWNGFNDPRGGGHFSGRITLPLVAAGVIAKKIASPLSISARIIEIGGIAGDAATPAVAEKIEEAISQGDSLGGIVECTVTNVPEGLGEPFFDSVESLISHAAFSIPGVRGIEFGDGFAAARMHGSEHNDPYGPDGRPAKNGSGGINGGITNGAPIIFRVAFKPTSSISKAQSTFDFQSNELSELKVPGRHDVCFALRTPVIVEAVTAIVLANLL